MSTHPRGPVPTTLKRERLGSPNKVGQSTMVQGSLSTLGTCLRGVYVVCVCVCLCLCVCVHVACLHVCVPEHALGWQVALPSWSVDTCSDVPGLSIVEVVPDICRPDLDARGSPSAGVSQNTRPAPESPPLGTENCPDLECGPDSPAERCVSPPVVTGIKDRSRSKALGALRDRPRYHQTKGTGGPNRQDNRTI
ncbi:hypothetical protein F5883DRAFT_136545 [Diaporthe sp. PMI_573]|nr:hypothetical protein F5883DRAFT_136545 [Diaporthaceae sp. PMI_573]